MNILPVSDNINYYLNNPNLIEITQLHNNANIFRAGQQINNLTVICPMKLRNVNYRDIGILWICKCTCGMYYLIKSSKLKLEAPKSCPSCDEHRIIDMNNNVRFSGKGENYYIQKYTDLYYARYFKHYIDLEDFKQELWYLFVLCEIKYGNKYQHFKHHLSKILNQLRKMYYIEDCYNVESLDNCNIDNIFYDDGLENLIDQESKSTLQTIIFSDNTFLSNRQQNIIQLRFYKHHTLNEIGKLYGLTRERVRQLEHKTLNLIKIFFTEYNGDLNKINEMVEDYGCIFKRCK